MICDKCLKDLRRSIVGMTGKMVNCLAYGCDNQVLSEDGYYRSGCVQDKKEVLQIIAKNFLHRPERLNPTDHIVERNEMICDSLNTANKK